MRLFLLILISLFIVRPALAQENINPESAPNVEEEIERLLGQKKQGKTAPQTLAAYSKEYRKRCLKVQHPVIAGKDLDYFCSCAAENIPTAMTLEQMNDAQFKTEEGYFQRSRMMMFVYAPCVKAPLRKMMYSDCIGNIRNKAFMKNAYATCGCLADDTSKHIQGLSSQYIQNAIKKRQDTLNPLDLLVPPDHFEKIIAHKTKVCLSRHEGIY